MGVRRDGKERESELLTDTHGGTKGRERERVSYVQTHTRGYEGTGKRESELLTDTHAGVRRDGKEGDVRTDTQGGRRTNRHTGRETYRQTHRERDIQRDIQTDTQGERQTHKEVVRVRNKRGDH